MKKSKVVLAASLTLLTITPSFSSENEIHQLISHHAVLNNVPEDLVHRIVRRESNYNPRAVGRGGAMGLMQIKHATARGMGYTGPASGLLDANTNLTYGVRYLAGAYRVAGGNHNRAISYYTGGYYYAAKRQGLTKAMAQRSTPVDAETTASVAPAPAAPEESKVNWSDLR